MEKQPLNLDWDELLPGRRHPRPPLEEAEAEAATFLVSELSDHELQEKIERLSKSITTGLLDKLPDKGHKFRSVHKHCCNELDRRNSSRIQKAVPECQRATQDKIAKSSEIEARIAQGVWDPEQLLVKSLGILDWLLPCWDSFGENGSNSTSVRSNSQGKPKDKTDAPFSEELRLISHDKCRTLSENGLQNQKERHPLEKLPQAVGISSSAFYPKKDKQRFSNCKSSDIGCPKIIPSSQARKHLSRRLSKRRRVSTYRGAKNRELEEVQHVVLLDDEDVQPTRRAQGGDTSDNWEEYKIYYPSRGDPECVELSYSDLKCLDPESYLSSPIMNFYIQYLQRSSSPMAKRNGDCYIFNTFFYSKLEEAMTSKDRTASFLKLRRWWKGVDIFQKAYIFLPIHGDMHWSLAIICIPAKEDESGLIILHLDSLGLHSSSHIFSIVGSYLKEEWIYINQNAAPPDFPISDRIWKNLPRRIEKEKITVPQQKNEYDCGLFVLYFMERFIEEAPERLKKKDISMFGRKWFQPEVASGLRNKVWEVLIKEFESNMLDDGIQESHASSSASENVAGNGEQAADKDRNT